MRASHVAVAVAALGLAGAARAESPVRANYVDEIGNARTSAPAVDRVSSLPSQGSPIAANYVDDFGSLLPRSRTDSGQHADVGAASGEPGHAHQTVGAQRSDRLVAYQHDGWVHQVWSAP